jgi:trans-aconitate 2-methyltransferase
MNTAVDRNEISNYYGSFCEVERDLKLNIRHYTVFKHLVKAGLKKNHSVLEIGCGFGTITYLMSKYLRRGKIVATDISAERIEACKRSFAKRNNATFVLTDMTDFESDEKFDFIVLPDVLEHIPLESHYNLFTLMANRLKEDGQIAIHIPHPAAIEYMRRTQPEVLQIIDQSVSSDELLRCAYENGLRLHCLQSYTLTRIPEDYQWIVFRKNKRYETLAPVSNNAIRWNKLKARLFLWRNQL